MRRPTRASAHLGAKGRTGLLLVLLASAAAPSAAFAQGQPQSGTGTSAATASQEDDPILVTARRREERWIDVPESIDVIGGEEIARNGTEDITDLYGTVPNLYLSANPLSPGRDFVSLVIRGVGAASVGSPSVATIVDNVYTPGLTFDTGFLDLERVEALRGPQGTLFGRNTSGGAINMVLRRPDETVRGRVALAFDEFETVRLQGAVSGPLGDSVFGGVAVDLSRSGGYLDNPVLDEDANGYRRASGRLALRYRPSGDLDVNLAIDGSIERGLEGLPGVPRASRGYEVFTDFQTDERNSNFGGSLNIEHDFGGATLTATTGFRDVRANLPFDFDGGSDLVGNLSQIITRLHGEALDGRLNWLVGVYGFKERHVQERTLNLPNGTIFPGGVRTDAQDQTIRRSGVAGFADLIYTLFGRLDLEAGVRLSRETVKEHFVLDLSLPNLFGPGVDLNFTADEREQLTFNEVSPTLAATFRWTPNFTTYARFAEGYRAGGFPLAPVGADANRPYRPESSYNYEIGLKADFMRHRGHLDIAVFYIDIRNQQLATILFLNDNPNLPVAAVGNAGRSRSQGFEASFDIMPTEGLTLAANVGYTDATYRNYVDTTGMQRAGERFPYVPRWTASLSTNYSFPISDGLNLDLFGRYRFVDDIVSGTGIEGDLQFPVDSYEVVDVRAGIGNGAWQLDAFVDNLFDKYIETRVYNVNFFPTSRVFAIVAPPRRAGIRASYRF
jgi:iron complex outermembrane receptor protein